MTTTTTETACTAFGTGCGGTVTDGTCGTCGAVFGPEPDRRITEAEAYVRTRFYPPLPYEYGAYAVQAVDACNEGDELRQIMLDPDLPLHPSAALKDESGSVSISAEGLVDALRLWHLVEDPDEHDCEEYLVEKGTTPSPNGAFDAWDECELCGSQYHHRRDSV